MFNMFDQPRPYNVRREYDSNSLDAFLHNLKDQPTDRVHESSLHIFFDIHDPNTYRPTQEPLNYRATILIGRTLVQWSTKIKETWEEMRKEVRRYGFIPVDGSISFMM
jgi:hypothetical protein